jgi:hypothetical protein
MSGLKEYSHMTDTYLRILIVLIFQTLAAGLIINLALDTVSAMGINYSGEIDISA